MATTNLGKVSVTPKGEYDPLITYERLDIISHNGSSYIVKQASTGVTPIEGDFYALIAEKGDGGSFVKKAYKTYAAMDADKVNIPANSSVDVTNDLDESKNGAYIYDGVAFTRSQYDSKVVTDKIISDTAIAVQDAINNTAVEGGVLADTFVTATKKTLTAVARSMRDVNSDTVSVLDFYDPIATPNNHTTAFNNAITYINSLGGGTLQVPDGVFIIDPAIGIMLKDNVELRGSKNTVITCGDHNLEGYALLRVHNTGNVSISNIKVDGNREGNSSLTGEWGMGISVSSAKQTTIRDVTVINCWGDGLYVGRTNEPGADSFSDGLVVENYYADNNRRQGISIVSLKNASLKNLYIKNTNGTLPEAGIDFEPDSADEWLHNIKVDNLYTENNSGAGVQVYFGLLGWEEYSTSKTYRRGSIVKFGDVFYKSLRSTINKQPDVSTDDWSLVTYVEGDRVKIDITNHVDVDSKQGYYSLGHQDKVNLSGVIKVHNASYYTEGNHNVFVQNNIGDAVQAYFYDCEFTNNIATGDVYEHVRISNAPANYKMGGVHLIRPTFRCEGIDTGLVYIYANNNNGLANINLSVTDIVSAPPVTTKVVMIARAVENFTLGDRFNNNTQSNLTDGTINSVNFIDTYTIEGEGNVNINSVSSGKRVHIVNNKTTRHVISLQNNITILGVTNTSITSFAIEPHGFVDLVGVSTTALKLVNANGLVNYSKNSFGTISLPTSTDFLANETKLVSTVTSLSGNKYFNTVIANSSFELGTNYAIRAEFPSTDVINVYITNLTSAPITLRAIDHYINLRVF